MVQIISDPTRGNIWGRISRGVAQGVAEQAPQEIERYRTAKGLEKFEQEAGNLTPMQQLARLSAIPGITPQQIQSFGELARQQQIRNAYQQYASRKGETAPTTGRQPGQPSIREQFQQQAGQIPFAGIPPNAPTARAEQPEYGTTPEINPVNPLGGQFAEIPPWTPERRNQEIADILDAGLAQTGPEAAQMAAQHEAAERSRPATEKANQDYLEGVKQQIRDEIDRQLQIGTQKQGAEVYKDITGDTRLLLERNVEKDLRENPRASKQEVVNRWIDKTREFIRSKPNLDALARRDTWDWMFKHAQTLDKLKSYQKTYSENNAEEEFFNKLRTQNTPNTIGFDMSPQGAAQIAYPRTKEAMVKINKYNPKNDNLPIQNAEMMASRIAKNLDEKDSILAILKDLRDKDPFFDQNAFLNYFRTNEVSLSPRQNRELQLGEGMVLPSWGDEWINFRRLK